MPSSIIGTVNESSLHLGVKKWYAQPGDIIETIVDGLLIDIVRGELLVEIQTSNFYSLRPKLSKLLPNHIIRIVYPVAVEKWVAKFEPGQPWMGTRRKSPRHKRLENIFDELVFLKDQMINPNLSYEILLIEQQDKYYNDGQGSWRRGKWSIRDHELLSIKQRVVFSCSEDFRALLPKELPDLFAGVDVVSRLNISPELARKMLYCYSKIGLIEPVQRRKIGKIYKLLKK